jgi:hypothetical protein
VFEQEGSRLFVTAAVPEEAAMNSSRPMNRPRRDPVDEEGLRRLCIADKSGRRLGNV